VTARLLTVLGPKGGVGKSTVASNMLVAARLDGIEAAGLDLDSQRSLAGWAETRTATGREPVCRVAEGRVTSWRDNLPDAELVVVDTPPGLEGDSYLEALQDLVLASDLVLVPALPKGPTFIKVRDVAMAFAKQGAVVVFVLNEADPRRVATAEAREYLREAGELCEVEIPPREDIHRTMLEGVSVVEDGRFGGSAEMATLWSFVAGRI
jgi:chromosome partitioning protein